MNVDQILNRINEDAAAVEKTASAPVATPDQTQGKTAAPANTDVVGELVKMAEDITSAEKEAEVAHVQLLGQAFADSAINKFAAYDAQVKIAAAQEAEQLLSVEQQKQASQQVPGLSETELNELIKAAAEYGYNEAVQTMGAQQPQQTETPKVAATGDEAINTFNTIKTAAAHEGIEEQFAEKVAEAAARIGYASVSEEVDKVAGYDAGVQEIHDVAAQEFLKGAAEAEVIINRKLAEVEAQ